MLKKKFKMQKTIESAFPDEFDKWVNDEVLKHSAQNVEVIRRLDVDGHCAYVVWDEETIIPETASDRLQLKGIDIRCGDCPFFELPNDKRIKFIKCEKSNEPVRSHFDRRACEWLCEQVEKGEVEI